MRVPIPSEEDCKLSDNLADSVKTLCEICQTPVTLTGMRSHTMLKHEIQITKYKELYGTLNEDVGTLRKRVECPVCLEIPRSGPVFVCKNGHFVCQKCKRGGIMLLYSSSTTGILAQASSVSYLIGSANTYKLWRNLGRLYL